MEKLSIKERVALYNSIVEARKSFFKKIRDRDLGEVSLQDAQLQTLLPLTGETSIEELKKQTNTIYNELKEYFDINNLQRQKNQMTAAFNVMKDMQLKLEFVKNILQQVVDDKDFDVLKASEDALRIARMADDGSSVASDETAQEVKRAVSEVSESDEDVDEGFFSRARRMFTGTTTAEGEEGSEEEEGPVRPALMRQRTEAEDIFGRDIERLKLPELKKIAETRYPVFARENKKTLLTRLGISRLKELLTSNVSNDEAIAFAEALMTGGVSIPAADTAGRRRVEDKKLPRIDKLRAEAKELYRIPGEKDIAIQTLDEEALIQLLKAPIHRLNRAQLKGFLKQLKNDSNQRRKQLEMLKTLRFQVRTKYEGRRIMTDEARRLINDENDAEFLQGLLSRDDITNSDDLETVLAMKMSAGPIAVGRGLKKKKRGRPKKGKGMNKRGRPKKEHLINSLVLHTGSKNAGNDNLDKDIKQIINRMHKNKMITASQKKELLKKYI